MISLETTGCAAHILSAFMIVEMFKKSGKLEGMTYWICNFNFLDYLNSVVMFKCLEKSDFAGVLLL